MRVFAWLWRGVRGALFGLAVVVVLIEEFGWRPLSAWLARIAQWPPLHWLEEQIRRLPARWALGLFLVPAVMLFPLKLAALGLIHRGHAASGLALILGAKVLGTAVVGRLFVLLEPQLMQFAWFVRLLDWWHSTKRKVNLALRASTLWRGFRSIRRRWRAWVRRTAR